MQQATLDDVMMSLRNVSDAIAEAVHKDCTSEQLDDIKRSLRRIEERLGLPSQPLDQRAEARESDAWLH